MVVELTEDEREAVCAALRQALATSFPRSPHEPLLMSVIRKLDPVPEEWDIEPSPDPEP